MAQVSRSLNLPVSTEEVWKLVGRFQGLPDWHPAFESSEKEVIDGVEHRRLKLVGGGEVLEKSWGDGNNSYGYEIVASPLPIANYRSTINVSETEGGGSTVTWSSSFEAKSGDARNLIASVYEAGLDALEKRYG